VGLSSKEIFLKKIGAQIVKHRQAKGWSQSELARACEKEPQSIERVENGKTNPTIYYLNEVAKALEISLKELFDFEAE
jgi:putative transcriptional regulator